MEGADLDQLAASFVTQYFEGLLLQPKSLAACYGPDSTMCVSYASGTSVEAKGPEEVKNQMLNLSAAIPDSKQLQVLHTEIFPSFDNSSLIIIEGVVLSPESSQEFTHTVILRNNGVEGEFYIRNDVWKFAAPKSTVEVAEEKTVAETNDVAEAEETQQENGVESEEAQSEEEAEETEQEAQEEEVEEEQSAKESSVADADVSMNESTASATVSEVAVEEKAAVTPPKAKGPINWASKARSAPTAGVQAKAPVPQRVSPKPQNKGAKEAAPKKESADKDEKPKRQVAQCFLVVKVRDVKDEEIKAAIPATLQSSLISMRNMSDSNSRVFLDFGNANAMEMLKAADIRIAGKPVSIDPQKKR